MPPVTRAAKKALSSRLAQFTSTTSAWGENNLRVCVTNYFKMSKSRRPYSKRMHFSIEHEIAFAQCLVNLHRKREISVNNISSYVVPHVQRLFQENYETHYKTDTLRAKYYAFRDTTKLYIAFKRRGTGMGWDSQNYTFLMDDSQWRELEQVNKKFLKFKDRSCFVYHLLEEVFLSQGATGDFSSGFDTSPPNSEEERRMEIASRGSTGKGPVVDISSDHDVPILQPKKVKAKKGKGKRKSGASNSESPIPCPSGGSADTYFQLLDGLQSHVSKRRSCSTSSSVSSPSKNAPPPASKEDEMKRALEPLFAMELEYEVKLLVADILKNGLRPCHLVHSQDGRGTIEVHKAPRVLSPDA